MPDPPRDADGLVQPHDDHETIPDDARLVRYIHRLWIIFNSDGTKRLSSGAFSGSSKDRDRYEGMSVDMFEQLSRDGINPAERMPPDHVAAVLLWAGNLRALRFQVGPDPQHSDDLYHASVWGVKKQHRGKIQSSAEWLIPPP